MHEPMGNVVKEFNTCPRKLYAWTSNTTSVAKSCGVGSLFYTGEHFAPSHGILGWQIIYPFVCGFCVRYRHDLNTFFVDCLQLNTMLLHGARIVPCAIGCCLQRCCFFGTDVEIARYDLVPLSFAARTQKVWSAFFHFECTVLHRCCLLRYGSWWFAEGTNRLGICGFITKLSQGITLSRLVSKQISECQHDSTRATN